MNKKENNNEEDEEMDQKEKIEQETLITLKTKKVKLETIEERALLGYKNNNKNEN